MVATLTRILLQGESYPGIECGAYIFSGIVRSFLGEFLLLFLLITANIGVDENVAEMLLKVGTLEQM